MTANETVKADPITTLSFTADAINTTDRLSQTKAVVTCLRELLTGDRSNLTLYGDDSLYGLMLILCGIENDLDQTIKNL